MENPFVTVFVPVYNAEKYLSTCLDSIIAQTFIDYELLLINDASKDSSLSICQKYATSHQNIRIISLEQNTGVMNARCLALKEAKGEYLLSVDADDYIEPTRLEKMTEAVKKNNSDIVITGFTRVVDKSGKQTQVCDSFLPGVYKDDKLQEFKQTYMTFDKEKGNRRTSPAVWMKLIKVRLVEHYVELLPNSIKMGEDALLSYLAIFNASSITVLNDYSYYYRIFPSQSSGAKYYIDYFKNALSIYTFIDEKTNGKVRGAVNENIVHVSSYAVMNEGFNNDKVQAKQNIKEICDTARVQAALSAESWKNQNVIYKLVSKNIKKKNLGTLYFLAKTCAFFMKLAS